MGPHLLDQREEILVVAAVPEGVAKVSERALGRVRDGTLARLRRASVVSKLPDQRRTMSIAAASLLSPSESPYPMSSWKVPSLMVTRTTAEQHTLYLTSLLLPGRSLDWTSQRVQSKGSGSVVKD